MRKCMFLLTLVSVFLIGGIAFAQSDVSVNVNVLNGNISGSSTYNSTVSLDGNNYISDGYSSKFSGIEAYSTTYNHTFVDGAANTQITGGSTFGVPGLRFEEKISTEQVDIDGKDCCGVAAGSKFNVFGVNGYVSSASPGGTGECCGVNYDVTAAEGAGTIRFEFVENKIGEDTIASQEEGGADTIINGNSTYRYGIKVNGDHWTGFTGSVVAPPCNPESPADVIPESIFRLCPWPDVEPAGPLFNGSTSTPQ